MEGEKREEILRVRPFRLATTSFIYPDQIIPNVKKLGRVFDEIELLLFESRPFRGLEVIPSRADVAELKTLGEDLGLTYNIHLPVDVSLTAASARERQAAADQLNRVLDRVAPLSPTTHTLHLDMEKQTGPEAKGPDELKAWEERARHGLSLLAPAGPEAICIETLWYDPAHFESIVTDDNFSVCADLGHHFKYSYDPARTFERFGRRIRLIHLHGVDISQTPPRDHLGLDRMPGDLLAGVTGILETYTGTVSIEVFGLAPLTASLSCLAGLFEGIPALSL